MHQQLKLNLTEIIQVYYLQKNNIFSGIWLDKNGYLGTKWILLLKTGFFMLQIIGDTLMIPEGSLNQC